MNNQKEQEMEEFICKDVCLLNPVPLLTAPEESFLLAEVRLPIAESIQKALEQRINQAVYPYEGNTEKVQRAISDWYKIRHGLLLHHDVLIEVSGVMHGISLLLHILANPADGVLIQPPVYHKFSKAIRAAGRKLYESPLCKVNGNYTLNIKEIEQQLLQKNIKVILLCNPHNPIGRVWKREELEALVEIANKYDVIIISDEIFSDIVYSGHKFNSLMAIAPKQHISMIGSPSKAFGLHSISNGYIYTENSTILEKTKKNIESRLFNSVNAFTACATIAAYRHGESWLDEFLIHLEKNIAWITAFLREKLPVIEMAPIEGTYVIWLDFSKTGFSKQTLHKLLQQAKIELAPGDWFGGASNMCMRMNIAVSLDKIQDAFMRLERVVSLKVHRLLPCASAPSGSALPNFLRKDQLWFAQ